MSSLEHRAVLRSLWAVAWAGAAVLVWAYHGLLPGLLGDSAASFLQAGIVDCLRDDDRILPDLSCESLAYPAGYRLLTGGPLLLAASAVGDLAGTTGEAGLRAASAVASLVGLIGGYKCLRMVGVARPLALAGGAAYQLSLSVVGLVSFPGTFTGFVLLPAYCASDLWLVRSGDDRRRLYVALPGYTMVRLVAVFLDGYSFVVSLVATGAIWLCAPVRQRSGRLTVIVAGVLINLFAVALYSTYSGGGFTKSPLDLPRAMGVDITTALVPSKLAFWSLFGAGADFSDYWGDGTNSLYNYLGLSVIVAVGLYLFGRRLRSRVVNGFLIAGAVAGVLALGPSLKFASTRPSPTPASGLRYEDYLMPRSAAVFEFPWSSLFREMPGIADMRATYRWWLLARWSTLLTAFVVLTQVSARGSALRRFAVGGVALLIVLDTGPNPERWIRERAAQETTLESVRAQVKRDIDRALRPGERIVFASVDGADNAYLANYLVGGSSAVTYNAGGDKNVAIGRRSWPPDIAQLIEGIPTYSEVARVLGGTAEVVIVPFFSVRWSAYTWPPAEELKAEGERFWAQAAKLVRKEVGCVEVRRFSYFGVLRAVRVDRGARGCREPRTGKKGETELGRARRRRG